MQEMKFIRSDLDKHDSATALEQLDFEDILRTFSIHGNQYMALRPAQPIRTGYNGPDSFATAIRLEGRVKVTRDWLQQVITTYQSNDDVFCATFLSGVIFTETFGKDNVEIQPGAAHLLQSWGTIWTEVLEVNEVENVSLSGPYLAFGGHLLDVFRLYEDTHGAFMSAIVLHAHFPARKLCIGGDHIQKIKIAVPSRLQNLPTQTKPLAGLRVAVKDIFQIRGLRTSLCNRSYYELYPQATETAGCIELLVQAGAKIVGTTKLASFAATEEPLECIDFQAPWNPRADEYQSPAGSSSGSGAAIAAYSWLDIAIGSDTSGSGRRPGHWNGCYAMRPSHGVLPVSGYIPSFRQFDVPTFFGREIEKCEAFAHEWYGKKLAKNTELPLSIVYPTEYMAFITNGDQLQLVEKFVSDLEASFGVRRWTVSFNELWKASPPPQAGEQSLQEYMKDACRNSFFHDDYHSFDSFRKDFSEEYHRTPYISPPVRWQWERSAKITKIERDVAVARLEVYREWFFKEVMRPGKYNTIVINPIENTTPRYRDDATSRFWPVGVPMLFLSPISGGPELTIPIGQVPFDSKVTSKREHLPVGVSLLASPGPFDAALAFPFLKFWQAKIWNFSVTGEPAWKDLVDPLRFMLEMTCFVAKIATEVYEKGATLGSTLVYMRISSANRKRWHPDIPSSQTLNKTVVCN